MRPRLLLLTPLDGDALARLTSIYSKHADIVVVRNRAELYASTIDDQTSLLAFGTGVIVPSELLELFSRPAYNVHPASPDFPGRDPHHHAVWRGANIFGATLHIMARRVDEGPIVAVELFDLAPQETPQELLDRANEAALRLIERVGPQILNRDPMPTLRDVSWGGTKTTRRDFLALTSISPLISKEELDQRYHAFDGGDWNNLTLSLHGRIFRIDKQAATTSTDRAQFADFTEKAFRDLLKALKCRAYRFARYGESSAERHVLWRHDVDFSMHRAARLAEIEAEEGVTATYFLNPHCSFYNLLESEIAALTRRILAAGHAIGLHFDAIAPETIHWTSETLEKAVTRERLLIETIVGCQVQAVSWHNPDLSNLLDFQDETIGGLFNAYSAALRRDYAYGSDSNGHWRFKPMRDLIEKEHPRLHLLTHPAWWTPEPLAPSERIDRAIAGRARATRRNYDALLAQGGRKNVTG